MNRPASKKFVPAPWMKWFVPLALGFLVLALLASILLVLLS